ncbi:hypothetical protein GCM10022377_13070 [Zhihengliuella alba]|uniref:Aminoglycoside phosphotransferase domain-containing protein n=1 Tax=Zhihengliuella alba TaxID=547018 RepID=A0ABP7DBI5_9MICC
MPWLPGTSAALLPPGERDAYAAELAAFLAALHRPAPAEAPANPFRGVPLTARREAVEARLAEVRGGALPPEAHAILPPGSAEALREVFEAAAAAPVHTGPALWLHGDPHPHNVVVEPEYADDPGNPDDPDGVRPGAVDGRRSRGVRLAAVVDFGDLTAGDPASDLGVAWMHFTGAGRARFRAAAQAGGAAYDDAVWRRGRGWAVAYGLIAALHPPAEPLHAVGLHTLAGLLAAAD